MLREERLAQIINQLQSQRRLSSIELIAQYGVTEGTIRRDLNELQQRGLLKKVHGGAIPPLADPISMSGRMVTATSHKKALALKAQGLIRNGQVILIDGGSTNLALAKLIPSHLSLTVFTNSLPIATFLLTLPKVDIHLLGGKVMKSSEITLDIRTMESLDEIRPDLCFIGIRSIHPQLGIATLSPDEARLKNKMISVSANTIALATNEKIGTTDSFIIGSFESIDTLILEDGAPISFITEAKAAGIMVIQ